MAASSWNHQSALKQAFRISGRSTPGVEEDQYLEEECSETRRRSPVPKSRTRAVSVPVKVPDRSKILMHDDQYNNNMSYSGSNSSSNYDDHWIDDDEEEEVDVARLPPHEMVMRRRGASPSVVEGVGRTLKGRDMIRVRNAIWTHIGFQD